MRIVYVSFSFFVLFWISVYQRNFSITVHIYILILLGFLVFNIKLCLNSKLIQINSTCFHSVWLTFFACFTCRCQVWILIHLIKIPSHLSKLIQQAGTAATTSYLAVVQWKKVYRAFDQEEGIEVAWNQVKLRNFTNDPYMIDRLYSEVRLLRTLTNNNIIALYNVWRDEENNTLNFITEVCTSGNLREYRKKHRHVSMKALKKWSKQILKGLDYLHTHEPCVIHRDLNCSNVFVNGNIGQVPFCALTYIFGCL